MLNKRAFSCILESFRCVPAGDQTHNLQIRCSTNWATWINVFPLWKHAYLNILKILPPKNENFQIKNFNIFHISAQNTDCGYSLEMPWWGSSNKYPQSMFLSRNKKNNVYPCKPQFYYTKLRFKRSILYRLFSWCYFYKKNMEHLQTKNDIMT